MSGKPGWMNVADHASVNTVHSSTEAIPPSLIICTAPHPEDLRDEWLGVVEAGKIIGVGRTQVWRYATEEKVLPYTIFGSADHPEYKFRRQDVLEFKRRRDEKRLIEQARREHRRRLRSSRFQRVAKRMLEADDISLEEFARLVGRCNWFAL